MSPAESRQPLSGPNALTTTTTNKTGHEKPFSSWLPPPPNFPLFLLTYKCIFSWFGHFTHINTRTPKTHTHTHTEPSNQTGCVCVYESLSQIKINSKRADTNSLNYLTRWQSVQAEMGVAYSISPHVVHSCEFNTFKCRQPENHKPLPPSSPQGRWVREWKPSNASVQQRSVQCRQWPTDDTGQEEKWPWGVGQSPLLMGECCGDVCWRLYIEVQSQIWFYLENGRATIQCTPEWQIILINCVLPGWVGMTLWCGFEYFFGLYGTLLNWWEISPHFTTIMN